MDVDYEEVFGVEAPEIEEQEDTGAEEGLQTEQPGTGSQVQEPGTAGDTGEEQEEEPAEGSETAPGGDAPSYESLLQRAEEEARRRTEQEVGSVISGIGLNNPYTGKPITSLAELRQYQNQFEQERRREFQEGHGMDDQSYQAFVEELPEVKAAREAAQRLQAAEVKTRIEEDIREIGKLDPTVKGLADLAKRPEYGQVCALVEKGYSLPDAWKLQNFDSLSQRRQEAARQETLNSLGGKGHLAPTSSRGEGAATVPAEVAAEYRQLVPDATDAEIQRHYDAYIKRTAG